MWSVFSRSPTRWVPTPGGGCVTGARRRHPRFHVFEPSTRTRVSFGSAFNLLGGEVRETTGFETSAIAKGESLYDTAGYSAVTRRDRHAPPADRFGGGFAAASRVPVINGGDGSNEHPSLALLDLYTIKSELAGRGRVSIACVSPWWAIFATAARCIR